MICNNKFLDSTPSGPVKLHTAQFRLEIVAEIEEDERKGT